MVPRAGATVQLLACRSALHSLAGPHGTLEIALLSPRHLCGRRGNSLGVTQLSVTEPRSTPKPRRVPSHAHTPGHCAAFELRVTPSPPCGTTGPGQGWRPCAAPKSHVSAGSASQTLTRSGHRGAAVSAFLLGMGAQGVGWAACSGFKNPDKGHRAERQLRRRAQDSWQRQGPGASGRLETPGENLRDGQRCYRLSLQEGGSVTGLSPQSPTLSKPG